MRGLVQEADIDVGAELVRLKALGGGGVASFTGIVRGDVANISSVKGIGFCFELKWLWFRFGTKSVCAWFVRWLEGVCEGCCYPVGSKVS